MAVKADSIIQGINLGLSLLIPVVRDLMTRRAELVAIRESGGDVTDEQWAAHDAEFKELSRELEELLRDAAPEGGGDPPGEG